MNRVPLAFAVAIGVLGCHGAGDADDDAADSETAADVTDTDDSATPALGDSPNPACETLVFDLEQLVAENRLPSPDPEFVRELYLGATTPSDEETPQNNAKPLQAFVRSAGAELGRVDEGVLVDDAEITAALGSGTTADLIAVQWRITTMLSLVVRARLYAVAESQPDALRDPALLYAQWDESYCLWNGGLRSLARQADALPDAPSYDDIEAEIEAAFVSGHGGIESPEVSWAIDPLSVKPAKQIAEKSTFVVASRLVLSHAAAAAEGEDSREAAHALGAFGLLEDRMIGRNTPGIDTVRTMLGGEPDTIDPERIADEIAIAFVKRARKYCDEAVEFGTFGTPDGVKGAWEGILYTRAILPFVTQRVPGTDASAWLATWAAYRDAIAEDDFATGIPAAEDLVALNCAVQSALGIDPCTAFDDAL